MVRQVVIDEQRPAQVCREHGLEEGLLLCWRRKDADRGEAAFTPSVTTSTEGVERRSAELERFCGQLTVEYAALKKGAARASVAERHAMIAAMHEAHPELPIRSLCELAGSVGADTPRVRRPR